MRLPALAASLLAASTAAADTYHLEDGDRITGKTLSQAAGQYRVQTPYGRITIPKGKIRRIVRDDGSEEVLQALPAPTSTPEPTPPPPPPVPLVFVVTGSSFWHAWSPSKDAALDPTLRLEVSLDEETVATYSDTQADPDIPGALVNSFSFDAGHVTVGAGEAVSAAPPDARPGRITLRLELPARFAGEHRLRIAYQANDGTVAEPAWRDVVEGAIHAELKAAGGNVVRLHQDRGRMEFSRKKMKNVETFRIQMGLE